MKLTKYKCLRCYVNKIPPFQSKAGKRGLCNQCLSYLMGAQIGVDAFPEFKTLTKWAMALNVALANLSEEVAKAMEPVVKVADSLNNNGTYTVTEDATELTVEDVKNAAKAVEVPHISNPPQAIYHKAPMLVWMIFTRDGKVHHEMLGESPEHAAHLNGLEGVRAAYPMGKAAEPDELLAGPELAPENPMVHHVAVDVAVGPSYVVAKSIKA